CAIGHSSGYIF
nr:immunoglobulin light chain junction region [Macaca mulatta]MPN65314.1 immunoglobulin light chain junction region [Macaca mulatta]MPN65385.1 immunoglobulin light chain junction region [Macaca mulatta]MPN65419.1 immunoglobulin light chain junction region [Macaca mulatta]MPN65452.1 immunoglobulin light chain junction region [Macaca mulatta]